MPIRFATKKSTCVLFLALAMSHGPYFDLVAELGLCARPLWQVGVSVETALTYLMMNATPCLSGVIVLYLLLVHGRRYAHGTRPYIRSGIGLRGQTAAACCCLLLTTVTVGHVPIAAAALDLNALSEEGRHVWTLRNASETFGNFLASRPEVTEALLTTGRHNPIHSELHTSPTPYPTVHTRIVSTLPSDHKDVTTYLLKHPGALASSGAIAPERVDA